MDDFDMITCEEYYPEDSDMRAWMDELERDYVNFELQVIADDLKAFQAEVEADFLALGA